MVEKRRMKLMNRGFKGKWFDKNLSLVCEACGLNIPSVLHLHHNIPKRDRFKGDGCQKILLCANCHNILHHQIGWGKEFKRVLTRYDTISLIKSIYKLVNKDNK